MSPRLSWILVGALCVFVSSARAQPDPITSNPPTAVPVTPLAPQNNPDRKRVFVIRLKHVRPSLMAYWLDPANHPAPVETPAITPAQQFVLPAGVDRIVVVDPQNSLLVFATESAAAQLQKDVDLLDKPLPDGDLPAIVPQRTVSLTLSVYWIDSLAPDSQNWQNLATSAHLARPEELTSLDALVKLDRASRVSLPPVIALDRTNVRLPFGLDTSTLVPPSIDPHFAPDRRSTPLKFDPFTINPDSTIDPGIQAYKGSPPLPTTKGDLAVQPLFSGDGRFWLIIKGTGVPFALLPTQEGSTFLLSGSAKAWGLTPPTPRFDSFVLSIQPHIQTLPITAAPPGD